MAYYVRKKACFMLREIQVNSMDEMHISIVFEEVVIWWCALSTFSLRSPRRQTSRVVVMKPITSWTMMRVDSLLIRQKTSTKSCLPHTHLLAIKRPTA
jgi:hypothetical protein